MLWERCQRLPTGRHWGSRRDCVLTSAHLTSGAFNEAVKIHRLLTNIYSAPPAMVAVGDDHEKHIFREPFVSPNSKYSCQINDIESKNSFSKNATLLMRQGSRRFFPIFTHKIRWICLVRYLLKEMSDRHTNAAKPQRQKVKGLWLKA